MATANGSGKLRTYNETFLLCRDVRHAWKPVGYSREAGQITRHLSCVRCGMVRRDLWTSKGERIKSRYFAPLGYRIEGGRIPYQTIRSEVVRRVTKFSSLDDLMSATFD